MDHLTHATDISVGDKKSRVPHLNLTYRTWERIQKLLRAGQVEINGHDLDIASVVAVAKLGCKPYIEKSTKLLNRLEESQKILQEHLQAGSKIYGVNTGFGGNADLRTDHFIDLQRALTQHQHSAILTKDDLAAHSDGNRETNHHSMPTSWVRGSMLVRCNTNIRGHSAVSWKTIDTLAELIRRNMTPIVPLRGSISASGDLMPLSYIAGVVQGNCDIFVRSGGGRDMKVLSSQEAFAEIRRFHESDIEGQRTDSYCPITLGPKEGLALVNGTAPSATVAVLALYEANQLAVLSQLISCLSSEALAANAEWTHPFIAEVRPHPGQTEVSQNMRQFFQGSKLVVGLDERIDRNQKGLVQDRYAIRSSPQWIGPQLEDLHFAAEQLVRELNSTTDNPLINSENRDVHCGANFQAASVTMAAEKTRLCLQMIGKMLFAQTTEMLNPMLNNGLPPNLTPDDPSLSYCLKGVDINMAAYQSELGFLTNPVSSHVQSAEMHNQAINSLALISSRYTMQSVELVSLMSASAIFAGLQGVDLRVMHRTFLESFRDEASKTIKQSFDAIIPNADSLELCHAVWDKICNTWYGAANVDANDRCSKVAAAAADAVITCMCSSGGLELATSSKDLLHAITTFKQDLQQCMLTAFLAHRSGFCKSPCTMLFLGHGTATLYRFVREELGVPFYRDLEEDIHSGCVIGRSKKTIGSWISIIYEALRDGVLAGVVLKSWEEGFVDNEGQ
ncbi:hypothetical protein LTR99_003244 [Exophiala xenobiotica]|uniref:Phenylalanine ammonia-lyase n=1 Tax=Vermiconidia calcicola TaxID=1690605 RepID=A0AAV9QBR0_9PEZI|nr:hypothetical protein H2202_006082 [Exophiala xenobiotica]KAK5538910.1 hypothetical protein LTR25_004454 [Vermiconidia calcicola]KAK5540520.1 hypothetical protein LTR23_006202 [Chaetothyriales sp. CCFEE 6169]KAK5194742.1 hypothetical protein LTR92_005986 [Exophiala xenobiotica]KAK5221732.1 hypothetical protein LTR72_005987 [Exophiala xenobiotica]